MLMTSEEFSASSIEFWLEQARELKSFAESCWSSQDIPYHNSAKLKLQGLATSMLDSSQELESELKWLYGNLMASAIQYLSIGVLIRKNPQRFQSQVPGNRILELTQECGIDVTPLQKNLLQHVENTFKWGEKFPQWNVPLTKDQLRALNG